MWKWEAEGQPRAVVTIIHSAYEHHGWYAWLIEQLRGEGYHVLTGDLPGHGELNRNLQAHDESFERYDLHVKKLMKMAFSYDLPVFVIGHGLGAVLAIHVMRKKYPVAGVIFTSPWLQLKLQPGKMVSALTSISAITSSMKVTHEIDVAMLTKDSEKIETIIDDIPYNTTVSVKWYRELQLLQRDITLLMTHKFPNVPVLVMTGENDAIIDLTASKKWLYQQKLAEVHMKEWPNCAHSLFHETERDTIFLFMVDYMNNVLRSIGYIVN